MLASRSLSSRQNTTQDEIEKVVQLALDGILPMFHPEKKLFCFRVNRSPSGLVKEGVSYRYTLMTLLGLQRAVSAGLTIPVDRHSILAELHRDTSWITNGGDLGLYLWLSAFDSPEHLQDILSDIDDKLLLRYTDLARCRTMELAWLLSGLAHARLAGGPELPKVTELAMKTYNLLLANQGPAGVFGHEAPKRIIGSLRGRIGTFADQVYPIYALSKFGVAYQVGDALQAAKLCAEAICRHQGPLGQWWWHYDSGTGRVIGTYPVYAVHQDGMAPLALFAVSEATEMDFTPFIYKGLSWISGHNELGVDLREPAYGLVWRSLYHSKPKQYANELMALIGRATSPKGLNVKYEDRPYHLGWVLYAFADRLGEPATNVGSEPI